jgi:hypothetical protein
MFARISLSLFIVFMLLGFAKEAYAASTDSPGLCPVSMELSRAESLEFNDFDARLKHVRRHLGRSSFQKKLNDVIATNWPEKKVIDVSTVFIEKILYRVEQEYLKNEIAQTVGLDHPQWAYFERTLKYITIHNGYGPEQNKDLAAATQKLQEDIKNLNSFTNQSTELEMEIIKARAVTRLANMYLFLERWNILNREISRLQLKTLGRKAFLAALGITAGGLIIASTIYAGPILAAAGAMGAKLSTDVVVAAQLARLAQVATGGAFGAAGAPTALLLTDTSNAYFEANRLSKNQKTVFVCELDKQIQDWKNRGVSPYLKASIIGGSMGLIGGALTLSKTGAKVVLYATAFGVGVAQLYSVQNFSSNTMQGLAEYALAVEAHAAGEREEAIEHLHASSDHFRAAKESFLNSVVVGVLAASIGKDFKSALMQGEATIRSLFSASADTLPFAAGVATDAVQSMAN